MPLKEEEIQLGDVYRDLLTGFQGVAIYKTLHLTSCTRVCLEGQVEEGKTQERLTAYEFDITRLEHVSSMSDEVRSVISATQEPEAKAGAGRLADNSRAAEQR